MLAIRAYTPAVEVALPTFARSYAGEFTGSELEAYFDREDIRADSFIGNTRRIEFIIKKMAKYYGLLRFILSSLRLKLFQSS